MARALSRRSNKNENTYGCDLPPHGQVTRADCKSHHGIPLRRESGMPSCDMRVTQPNRAWLLVLLMALPLERGLGSPAFRLHVGTQVRQSARRVSLFVTTTLRL